MGKDRTGKLGKQRSFVVRPGKVRGRRPRPAKCTSQHTAILQVTGRSMPQYQPTMPSSRPTASLPISLRRRTRHLPPDLFEPHTTLNPRRRAALGEIVGPSRHQGPEQRGAHFIQDRAVGGTRCRVGGRGPEISHHRGRGAPICADHARLRDRGFPLLAPCC